MSFSINSLWPNDTIWRHRSWSTLAQVMACFPMAPSHHLNESWLLINEVLWHSLLRNGTVTAKLLFFIMQKKFTFEITVTSGQWVNMLVLGQFHDWLPVASEAALKIMGNLFTSIYQDQLCNQNRTKFKINPLFRFLVDVYVNGLI